MSDSTQLPISDKIFIHKQEIVPIHEADLPIPPGFEPQILNIPNGLNSSVAHVDSYTFEEMMKPEDGR